MQLFNHVVDHVEELRLFNHVVNYVEELKLFDIWCSFGHTSCRFWAMPIPAMWYSIMLLRTCWFHLEILLITHYDGLVRFSCFETIPLVSSLLINSNFSDLISYLAIIQSVKLTSLKFMMSNWSIKVIKDLLLWEIDL